MGNIRKGKDSITQLENSGERLTTRVNQDRLSGLRDKVEDLSHSIKEYKICFQIQ